MNKVKQSNVNGDNVNGTAPLDADKSAPTIKINVYGHYWVSGIALVISFVCFCATFISHGVIVDHISIILGFIGVLATFTVLGNYVQVKRAEDRIDLLQKDIDRLASQVDRAHTDIAQLRESISVKSVTWGGFNER